MDTKWAEDFICLADTRSFSRSATERHASQSAFSRRIQALESWLGAELVDRSCTPLSLTPAGHVFRRLAVNIVQQANQARVILNHGTVHTGVLTGAPSGMRPSASNG
ncbi:MAG: LysR family transcriptional regulator [Pseudomonadota bacterium]